MIKSIYFSLFLCLFSLFTFAKEETAKKENINLKLAKMVLMEAKALNAKIAEGSKEELAFNIIYYSEKPGENFKSVYQYGNTTGKLYALIGLHLLKDPAFEILKKEFDSKKQKTISIQYNCKGQDDADPKEVLKSWIEGIPEKLWYTQILIDDPKK